MQRTKDTQITLSLSKEQKDFIKEKANQESIKPSTYAKSCLIKYLSEKKGLKIT